MQPTKTSEYDVIVIGAGPAGMMAAGVASERGKKVLLLEKNGTVGKKLSISGGGRCNITNAEDNLREFLSIYGETDKFLFSPFSQFNQEHTFDFFASKGLPLVVEARKRAFPQTQNAKDVTKTMKNFVKSSGVKLMTGTAVNRIITKDGMVTGIDAKGIVYTADSYVLATGGVAYPETGSTGDGQQWMKTLGHTVHPPSPSIAPLKVKESWVKQLSGVSLSFMKITFWGDDKKAFSKTGKILFTHFGISGPLILNCASEVMKLKEKGSVTATIDMYPDTDHGALETNIIKVLDQNKNKDFKNIVGDIAPRGLGEAILTNIPTLASKKAHSVTREERKQLIAFLKAAPISITGIMGWEWAVVADGGVDLSEVDTKTMRSKLYPNLYLTGDTLNINRPSGGYSLQLCWTTGYVAGNNA